jgi:uncharacterized protein YqhQ
MQKKDKKLVNIYEAYKLAQEKHGYTDHIKDSELEAQEDLTQHPAEKVSSKVQIGLNLGFSRAIASALIIVMMFVVPAVLADHFNIFNADRSVDSFRQAVTKFNNSTPTNTTNSDQYAATNQGAKVAGISTQKATTSNNVFLSPLGILSIVIGLIFLLLPAVIILKS